MRLAYAGKSGKTLKTHSPHSHRDWELIYNISGSGTMLIEGTAYPFAPGSVILCPPNAIHVKSSEEGFEDCYLGISGWNLPPAVYVLEDDHEHRIAQLLGVLNLTWHESGAETVCQDLMHAVIGLLQPALSGGNGNKYVQMLRLSMIQNFTDPDLRLQDLQSDFPVNPDYLRRLFRQEHGMSPHEYLTKLRLDHAAHLLCYEGASVSEAAFRAGFYDPLYFSRLFHRRMGMPPSSWRMNKPDKGLSGASCKMKTGML